MNCTDKFYRPFERVELALSNAIFSFLWEWGSFIKSDSKENFVFLREVFSWNSSPCSTTQSQISMKISAFVEHSILSILIKKSFSKVFILMEIDPKYFRQRKTEKSQKTFFVEKYDKSSR